MGQSFDQKSDRIGSFRETEISELLYSLNGSRRNIAGRKINYLVVITSKRGWIIAKMSGKEKADLRNISDREFSRHND